MIRLVKHPSVSSIQSIIIHHSYKVKVELIERKGFNSKGHPNSKAINNTKTYQFSQTQQCETIKNAKAESIHYIPHTKFCGLNKRNLSSFNILHELLNNFVTRSLGSTYSIFINQWQYRILSRSADTSFIGFIVAKQISEAVSPAQKKTRRALFCYLSLSFFLLS